MFFQSLFNRGDTTDLVLPEAVRIKPDLPSKEILMETRCLSP